MKIVSNIYIYIYIYSIKDKEDEPDSSRSYKISACELNRLTETPSSTSLMQIQGRRKSKTSKKGATIVIPTNTTYLTLF